MLSSRRKKYYKRCQEIIDDLHHRVANNESLSEQHCINRYGLSDYQALLHELHMMNADLSMRTMTPAMEWLYHSQYFKNKAADERNQARMYWISLISACAAIISVIYTFFSNAGQEHMTEPCETAYRGGIEKDLGQIPPTGISLEIRIDDRCQ